METGSLEGEWSDHTPITTDHTHMLAGELAWVEEDIVFLLSLLALDWI